MPSEEGRDVLRLLAEKKVDAEQAYRLLVALGDLPKREERAQASARFATDDWKQRFGESVGAGQRGGGKVLRIRVTEGGRQKVNMALPLSLARLGRTHRLERIVGRFGIDLRDIAREIVSLGKIVDVVDEEGDRMEIFVE